MDSLTQLPTGHSTDCPVRSGKLSVTTRFWRMELRASASRLGLHPAAQTLKPSQRLACNIGVSASSGWVSDDLLGI
jgi:hypothetical protein